MWGGARITLRGYYPSTSGNSPSANGLGYQVFLNDIPITDATGATVLDDIDYSTLGSAVVIKGPAWARAYDLLGLKVGYKKKVTRNWLLDVSAGGDNLAGRTYYSFLFVGPNIVSLAQSQDGGRGDGYIIPAPYTAQFYGNISLRYVF